MSVLIIIPALNPTDDLINYVDNLKAAGEENILIVDDGSRLECKSIFDELVKKKCILLRHACNMGKGRALKDAFNYFLTNYESECMSGVITVDSDGQHTVEDVLKMKKALEEHPDSLILGVRNFNNKEVPSKSSYGNKITRTIMKCLYGGNISDTQTGLRAIPTEILIHYLTLYGERFEYETSMLIETLQKKIPIYEVKIRTVYFEKNKNTHFKPIVDSFKIYKIIFGTFFKYVISSLSAAIVDLSMFYIFTLIFRNSSLAIKIGLATVLARVISSLFNYLVNCNIVFKKENKVKSAIIRYYLLCIFQMCTSALLVYLICKFSLMPEVMVKIFVDFVLFLINFKVQQIWVFEGGK